MKNNNDIKRFFLFILYKGGGRRGNIWFIEVWSILFIIVILVVVSIDKTIL